MINNPRFSIMNLSQVAEFKDADIKRDEANEPQQAAEKEKANGEIVPNLADAETNVSDNHLKEPMIEGTKQRGLTISMAEFKHIYTHEIEKENEKTQTRLELVLEIISTPGKYACMCIIPNVDEEALDKWYVPAMPLASTLASILLTKSSLF